MLSGPALLLCDSLSNLWDNGVLESLSQSFSGHCFCGLRQRSLSAASSQRRERAILADIVSLIEKICARARSLLLSLDIGREHEPDRTSLLAALASSRKIAHRNALSPQGHHALLALPRGSLLLPDFGVRAQRAVLETLEEEDLRQRRAIDAPRVLGEVAHLPLCVGSAQEGTHCVMLRAGLETTEREIAEM